MSHTHVIDSIEISASSVSIQQYDRDFLLQLQSSPLSKRKPTGLPDIEGLIKEMEQSAKGKLELNL